MFSPYYSLPHLYLCLVEFHLQNSLCANAYICCGSYGEMLEPHDLRSEICTAISHLSLKVLVYFVVDKYLILKGGADERDAQHHK